MRHRLRAFAVASVSLLYQHVTTVSVLQNWWVFEPVLICFFNTVLCASPLCIVGTVSVSSFVCSTHYLVKSTECSNNVICRIFLLLHPSYVQTAHKVTARHISFVRGFIFIYLFICNLTGLHWLKIEKNSGLLWKRWRSFGFPKMEGLLLTFWRQTTRIVVVPHR